MKESKECSFQILTEAKSLLKGLFKENPQCEMVYMNKIKELLFALLKHNQKKFSQEKFQFFIAKKLNSKLQPFFSESSEKYLIFLKMIFYKLMEPKQLSLYKELFIFLLYFFKTSMNLYDILLMYTAQTNFSLTPFFFRFLFENLGEQTKSVKEQIDEYLFNELSPKFTQILFKNFFLFLLINIALNNFQLCSDALIYFLNFKLQEDSIPQFSEKFSALFAQLEPYFHDQYLCKNYYFLKFVSISLMVLPQNQIFLRLHQFLHTHYIFVRN